jgi:hypothetical protein
MHLTFLPLQCILRCVAAFSRVVATRVENVNFVWAAGASPVAPVTNCMADFFRFRGSLLLQHRLPPMQSYLFVSSLTCATQRPLVWVSFSKLRGHWPSESGRACTGQRVQCVTRLAVQEYTFQTTTTAGGDEGVRLWVDGQMLIDAWATSRLCVCGCECVSW